MAAINSSAVKMKKFLEACSTIPVRNFLLFVTVKLPSDYPDLPDPEDFGEAGKTAPLFDIKWQTEKAL
ncbi:MAG: hypothetical protein KKH60_00705 [Proteobacteria bacterium]|nr:hypothetical protein [Pseudomonadota bacterium]